MAWVLMSLRINELQRSVNEHTYEKLEITRQLRRLSNFSTAVADGTITPGEIASLGTDLFGDGLDFMTYAHEEAMNAAQIQTDAYADTYGTITQEQYYTNPAIAARAELYFDADGNLNTEEMYAQFYEEALKEYAQTVIAPMLKEKESELEEKQTQLEVLVESENSELQALRQGISSDIQQHTIKIS